MRKSILIVGASHAGKSTTAKEVCKLLNPSEVFRLDIGEEKLIKDKVENIFNNTFVINVSGRFILIVAGATTEQGYKITSIIDVCVRLKIEIFFTLVSMRSFERKKGFYTKEQLEKVSEILLVEKIKKINGDFKNSIEWRNRINKIVDLIKENL